MRRKQASHLLAGAPEEALLTRSFHNADESELHFRYVGRQDGRHFVVNVQIPAIRNDTGARLSRNEYSVAVADVLEAVLAQAYSERKRGG